MTIYLAKPPGHEVVKFPLGFPAIFCRPCGKFHELPIDPNKNGSVQGVDFSQLIDGDVWDWNYDVFYPTFSPPWLGKVIRDDGSTVICHFIVSDGKITYLPETTHDGSGQTFDLLPPPQLGDSNVKYDKPDQK